MAKISFIEYVENLIGIGITHDNTAAIRAMTHAQLEEIRHTNLEHTFHPFRDSGGLSFLNDNYLHAHIPYHCQADKQGFAPEESPQIVDKIH